LFSDAEARGLQWLWWFIFATGVGVALAIVVLGWLAGRLLPRVRHVAPFAVAGLAYGCMRFLLKDWWWQYFAVSWFLAAAAVALYWTFRRPPGSRSTEADPRR
jgi:hypothetical protein